MPDVGDLQALLTAQAGGQPGGLDLMQLLAGGAAGGGAVDDQLGLVMRLLEQRQAAAPDQPVDLPPTEAELELERIVELRERSDRRDERATRARELKELMTRLYAELETLRARSDLAAAALGACYLCFGEDLTCPECGGRGRPGSLVPEAGPFRRLVTPAVNRIRRLHPDPSNGAHAGAGKEWQSTDPPSRPAHDGRPSTDSIG